MERQSCTSYEKLADKGLYFWRDCCFFKLLIYPMDLRYNGAQITGVVNIPECFDSSNMTESVTVNIQGIYIYIITMHVYI